MSAPMKPCLDCGEPTPATRCTECSREQERTYDRAPKSNASARGYDTAWRKLSERARATQPWCTDCGTTKDLQTDHTPRAWERYLRGLPIRLSDVDVVCGDCNRGRGDARPGGERSRRHAATRAGQAGRPSHIENRSQMAEEER